MTGFTDKLLQQDVTSLFSLFLHVGLILWQALCAWGTLKALNFYPPSFNSGMKEKEEERDSSSDWTVLSCASTPKPITVVEELDAVIVLTLSTCPNLEP